MEQSVIKSQLTAQELSASRIGQIWRQEDHELVVRQIGEVERLARSLGASVEQHDSEDPRLAVDPTSETLRNSFVTPKAWMAIVEDEGAL